MATTSVEFAAGLLRQRREELSRIVPGLRVAETAAQRLSRIFLIENDYALATQEAEITWIDRILDAVAARTLTWDSQRLIDQADRYEQ